MVNRVFRSEPVRLHLGTLSRVPRQDLERHAADGGGGSPLDAALHRVLVDLFALPPAAEAVEPREDDLAVDVAIVDDSRGGTEPMPRLWRPEVTLSARLYSLRSGAARGRLDVTEVVGLPEWLASLRPGADALATKRRMEALVRGAARRLRSRVEAWA